MRTHTYQYASTTPVPGSTPPEHRPNADDTPTPSPRRSVRRRPTAADVARIDASLAELELKREEQLASLRDAPGDLVATAYQQSVARILAEIRDARRRLREGKHGVCVACHGVVTDERMEALPWATTCADCARRHHSWLR